MPLASLLVIASCAAPPAKEAPQPEPVEPVAPEPTVAPPRDREYVDLIRAAVDAFCREDFELTETHATAALRLHPDDPLADDLLMDSRRLRHFTMGPYIDLRKREYREACDALRPPAPP